MLLLLLSCCTFYVNLWNFFGIICVVCFCSVILFFVHYHVHHMECRATVYSHNLPFKYRCCWILFQQICLRDFLGHQFRLNLNESDFGTSSRLWCFFEPLPDFFRTLNVLRKLVGNICGAHNLHISQHFEHLRKKKWWNNRSCKSWRLKALTGILHNIHWNRTAKCQWHLFLLLTPFAFNFHFSISFSRSISIFTVTRYVFMLQKNIY